MNGWGDTFRFLESTQIDFKGYLATPPSVSKYTSTELPSNRLPNHLSIQLDGGLGSIPRLKTTAASLQIAGSTAHVARKVRDGAGVWPLSAFDDAVLEADVVDGLSNGFVIGTITSAADAPLTSVRTGVDVVVGSRAA